MDIFTPDISHSDTLFKKSAFKFCSVLIQLRHWAVSPDLNNAKRDGKVQKDEDSELFEHVLT